MIETAESTMKATMKPALKPAVKAPVPQAPVRRGGAVGADDAHAAHDRTGACKAVVA